MIRTLWRFTLFRQYRRYSFYRSLALANLLAPLFEVLKPHIVIDVGGYQSSWLKFVGNPENVITVDIDPKALKNSLATHKVLADAQHLPFRRLRGSLLLAISILEHLPRFDKCLKDMINIGDWVLIQIPNLRGLVEPHTAILLPFIIPRSMLKAIIRREFPGLYVNFLCTKNNLTKILKQYKDTSILTWDYIYPPKLFHGVLSKLFQLLQLLPHGHILLLTRIRKHPE